MGIYFYGDTVPEPVYNGPECFREQYLKHYRDSIIWFHEIPEKTRREMLRNRMYGIISNYVHRMCARENLWNAKTQQLVSYSDFAELGGLQDYYIQELFRSADDLALHPKNKIYRDKLDACVKDFVERENHMANYISWYVEQRDKQKEKDTIHKRQWLKDLKRRSG